MQHTNSKLAVSALALLAGLATAGGPANATTTPLYGGGGTLAAKVYRQIFNCYAVPLFGSTNANSVEGAATPFPASLPTTECSTTAGSPAPPYTAPYNATSATIEFLYSPIGSGGGLTAFTTETAPSAAPATSNAVAFTTTAFSAYPYPALDFVGSDAALTTTQVSSITASTGLAAIQVPAFGTPIALPLNPGNGFQHPSNYKVPAGGSGLVHLSIDSVCGIFTGGITNWQNSHLTADNGGIVMTGGSRPINVIVRSDSSGTSQIFSNWLVINCASTSFPVANGFVASTTPAWPSAFTKVSGSGGIANAINSTTYSIGYVSPDYVRPVVSTGPQTANIVDPKGTAEPPASANTTIAVEHATAPTGTAAANAYNWGQPINNQLAEQASLSSANYPTSAYPIVGFTFLDFYQCYSATSTHNPQAANQLKTFLENFYFVATGGTGRAEMNLLINSNGFGVPQGAFLGAERTLVEGISYTGKLNNVTGSTACNATGVKGVNG